MSEKRTHWKQLINPDYLGAYSLPNGNDLTVTIEKVSNEIVTGPGGKKEECVVLRLKGQKPFILNVTNSKSIHRLYGPYIEDWIGKEITLHSSTTKFAGELVECVRIRPDVARKLRPSITDERLKKAIESIQNGSFTYEALFDKFTLNSEQVKFLEEKREVNNASD